MSYLVLDQSDIKSRYNERLQEAAAERRARRVQALNGKSLVGRLQAMVQAVVNIGRKVNAQPQPNTQSRPVQPVL